MPNIECRINSSIVICAALSSAAVRWLIEKPHVSFKYEIMAMAAGHGLHLLPTYYIGSAGRKLENLSDFLPSLKQRNLMAEAGADLQLYESRTYWGYGLETLGIAGVIVGVDRKNNAMIATGSLTALAGWILSSPAVVWRIKTAATKIDELGNRLSGWK